MKTPKNERPPTETESTATTASGIAVHCAFDALEDLTALIANPRNPNKHGDKQVALLAKVIRNQGWRSPVVVSKRSGFVVTGHGRLETAKLLQVQTVPVNFQEFASEADEWAHVIADNRIAELAETDGAALRELLHELDTGEVVHLRFRATGAATGQKIAFPRRHGFASGNAATVSTSNILVSASASP